MKKFLSLTLLFLTATLGAKADHWTYQEGQYENETFVFADVTIETETANGFDERSLTTLNDYAAYEYAAFVEGQLRGVATIMANNNGETTTYLLRFRIEGGSNDMDGNLTFKAYDKEANKEFDLVPAILEPLVFSGETLGTASVPIHMQILYPLESVAVTSITTPFYGWSSDTGNFSYIECNVGDDLTPYFTDGQAFDVLPADASDKSVTFSLYEGNLSLTYTETNGKITCTATGEGIIKVTSVSNPEISCMVYVVGYNDYTTLSATQDVLNVTYKNEDVNITEQVMPLFVLGPADRQTIGGNYGFESSAPAIVEINDNGAFAKAPGEATLTATMDVVNRLMKTFDPNGNHTTTVSASVLVVVKQGVTGLSVQWPATMATEQYSDVVVSPLPAGAEFNKNATFTITGSYGNYDGVTVDNTACFYDDGPKQGIGWVYGEIPGDLTLTVTYDDGEGTVLTEDSEPIECGYTFGMNEGWEWRSIPYANFNAINSLQNIFGTELVEIRTQGSQLFNDPLYGYFGDNGLLNQNVGFKLKMGELPVPPSQETVNYNKSYVFYGGSLGMNEDITLRKGWNYLPNPFVKSQSLTDLFDLYTTFVEGDRIVSKDDGFAEYSGDLWTGTLTNLRPGQGYLFYNAGDANRNITYINEFNPPSSRRLAPRRAPKAKLWSYDASRFRDNMTIVASMDDDLMTGQYSVGAFVGDECRGEGQVIDGRLFITVHANGGELISFKLRSEITGELFDIDQTVRMQQMLGTVKQPFSLTSDMVVTGIQSANRESVTNNQPMYDLSGRRIDSNSKGIRLQKGFDGKVHKVMR